MAESIFVFSEAVFFEKKDSENNRTFVEDAGVNLDKECRSAVPTTVEKERSLPLWR